MIDKTRAMDESVQEDLSSEKSGGSKKNERTPIFKKNSPHSSLRMIRGGTREEVVSESKGGASLVAQWLRICLPMQGTRVRALVGELRSRTL